MLIKLTEAEAVDVETALSTAIYVLEVGASTADKARLHKLIKRFENARAGRDETRPTRARDAMRLLLQLLNERRALTPLTERGLTYAEVGALLGQAYARGYATDVDGLTHLTPLGEATLAEREEVRDAP